MHFLDLPNEILRKIFSYGGPEALLGGLSQTCRRLRDVSCDAGLWDTMLAPKFRDQFLSPQQIASIPDLREWCIKQNKITQTVVWLLDRLIVEYVDYSFPVNDRAICWEIVQYRFRALEGLNKVLRSSISLAHCFWAQFLTRVLYHLEGISRLVAMSSPLLETEKTVENPIDILAALYMLRSGECPEAVLNAINNDLPLDLRVILSDLADRDLAEVARIVVQKVEELFEDLKDTNEFLVSLGKAAVFMTLWSNLGLSSRLVRTLFGTYVCVYPVKHGAEVNQPPFFVDFQRHGRLRTLHEFRDMLQTVGVTDVHYGISMYDVLSNAYAWTSISRHSGRGVLDLIEHAAKEIRFVDPIVAPNLFETLVDAALAIMPEEEVTLSEYTVLRTPRKYALDFGYSTGQVVRIRNTPHVNEFVHGVMLSTEGETALVATKNNIRRVVVAFLRPVAELGTTEYGGFTLPDIDIDFIHLGQYFRLFNAKAQKFE